MSKDEFTERYELVGRSFRYVVDDRTPLGDVKARIDEALSSVDLSALEADMHSPSTDKKLTSRVVYIDVGSGPDGKIRFSMPIFRFATRRVEQEVMNRAFEGNLVALWRAVDSRRFWMGNEVEWGLRFELTALKMLTKRTRLRMEQLFPNGTRGASFDVPTPCAVVRLDVYSRDLMICFWTCQERPKTRQSSGALRTGPFQPSMRST